MLLLLLRVATKYMTLRVLAGAAPGVPGGRVHPHTRRRSVGRTGWTAAVVGERAAREEEQSAIELSVLEHCSYVCGEASGWDEICVEYSTT